MPQIPRPISAAAPTWIWKWLSPRSQEKRVSNTSAISETTTATPTEAATHAIDQAGGGTKVIAAMPE